MDSHRDNRPFYEVVRDEIRHNIVSGNLPLGTLLLEAALTDRLRISRAPVKRALELLSGEGLIVRAAGRGYVVGSAANGAPEKRNLHTLHLDLSPDIGEVAGRAIWYRIYAEVENQVLACMPFGTYQISEAALGEHFDVSRTVVRDVLGRMHSRGLIGKNARSHWIAGPLSVRILDEWHEVRIALEPRALTSALPHLEPPVLRAMIEAIEGAQTSDRALDQSDVDRFEDDLHRRCLEPVRNRRLADTVEQAQIGLIIDGLFGTYIGAHSVREMLVEHRLVFEHLVLGDGRGAAAALEHHLEAEHVRSRARLKALSMFTEPVIAPYLVPVH